MTATTTFADYAAAAEARKDIATAVLGHSYALCEALRQNFIDYSIRSHYRSLQTGENTNYHEECIAKLKEGICNYNFTIESGRKYHKIIMVIDNGPDRSPSRSVHAFVDKKTGEVYKSASWSAPAKGVRYDLRIIEQREWVLENATWCGQYLYAK
jgi:hypothetical protein